MSPENLSKLSKFMEKHGFFDDIDELIKCYEKMNEVLVGMKKDLQKLETDCIIYEVD